MKTRAAITLGLSALMLGGTLAAATHSAVAMADTHDEARSLKQASAEQRLAQKALDKGQPAVAILHGETAVRLAPQVAAYRLLLAQSYLKAGRFASARQAFADTLTLDPGNGKAALNLALSQIADGAWDDARKTLDSHSTTIAVSDRGLAMALAGDPAGAVELLSAAARTPDADAKTRQNLALSLALAGRWQEAKTVAALDMSPADVDGRIMQWASFAKPTSASDQVAALLGVTAVQDAGQPVALALAAQTSPSLAAADQPSAQPVPAEAVAAAPAAPDSDAPMAAPAADPQLAATAPAAPATGAIRFNARQEVVQPTPSHLPTTAPTAKLAAAPSDDDATSHATRTASPAHGSFYVQLGAYQSAAVAHDAWGRAIHRFSTLGDHAPSGNAITSRAGNFYRLSIGGFARADAEGLCRSYKAKGGDCFVRPGAGDQVARWAQGAKLASR